MLHKSVLSSSMVSLFLSFYPKKIEREYNTVTLVVVTNFIPINFHVLEEERCVLRSGGQTLFSRLKESNGAI